MSSEERSECLPLESMAFDNRSQRRKQDASMVSGKSLCTDFLCSHDTFDSDEFQTKVTVKTRTEMLMQSEAEREVVVDHLIQQEETKEKALFYVLKTRTSSEPNILLMVSALLARRANPSCREENDGKQSPLHHASEKGFVDVVKELLSKGARPDIRDKDGELPVHIAVSNHNDDIAALLVLQMDNKT
ncbi:hypothetical protein V1264_007773 [Littorina saxatilis]|uniref:Uncharacterized protein n=1 Tax=Littorina saxatilis TaxID=31220 RepID=A0AAN9AVM9_9CAEN